MKNQIEWQRIFNIPAEKLNLFLIKIEECNELSRFEAKYIFQKQNEYDVVVVELGGRYPFMENTLEEFAKALNENA